MDVRNLYSLPVNHGPTVDVVLGPGRQAMCLKDNRVKRAGETATVLATQLEAVKDLGTVAGESAAVAPLPVRFTASLEEGTLVEAPLAEDHPHRKKSARG